MTQPLEGRSVWCTGDTDNKNKGWIRVSEHTATHVSVTVSPTNGYESALVMTREEAKTFAAQMMNLANRSRA